MPLGDKKGPPTGMMLVGPFFAYGVFILNQCILPSQSFFYLLLTAGLSYITTHFAAKFL